MPRASQFAECLKTIQEKKQSEKEKKRAVNPKDRGKLFPDDPSSKTKIKLSLSAPPKS